MDGQMTIFDLPGSNELSFEEIHEQKPWARLCSGHENECFEHPENGICTSFYQCSRRREYKTVNSYYLEQLGHRGLSNPIDGCTILVDETKAEADKLIEQYNNYFKSQKKR